MIKLEIDDDVADEIVRASLVDTYVWLKTDLKNAENNTRNYHEDDVAMWKKVVAAIEELSDWYFVHGKFKEAVKKAKKEMQ